MAQDLRKLFVILKHGSEEQEWTTMSSDMSFDNILHAFRRNFPSAEVLAFEYEDEEGDRITVWSDEELQTMLRSFFDSSDGLCLTLFSRIEQLHEFGHRHLKIGTKDLQVQHFQQFNNFSPMTGSPVSNAFLSSASNSKVSPATVGENLCAGDLELTELLGSGNGGSVYRAIHRVSGVIMALKVIQLDVNRDVQRQILREFSILDQCSCPYIIQFYGSFFVDNQISICTEHMDGGSLDRYGQLPEWILGPVTVCIVKGLLYLWSKKIMHRDIKPSNVVVSSCGKVKLCDFGVSIQLMQTIAKTFIGTNAYMAPERIMGEDYSLAADVWSLGVTLFELATGALPYNLPRDDSQPLELFAQILHTQPATLPRQRFSHELTDFVSRCMQHSPTQRLNQNSIKCHPYVQQHEGDHTVEIAAWVQSRMKNRHLNHSLDHAVT